MLYWQINDFCQCPISQKLDSIIGESLVVHYGIKKIYAIIHICNEDGKFMKNQQVFHWIEIKLIFFLFTWCWKVYKIYNLFLDFYIYQWYNESVFLQGVRLWRTNMCIYLMKQMD